MIEILLSLVIIIFGYLMGRLKDAAYISISIILTSSVRFFGFEQIVYTTALIIIYCISLQFIRSPFIKASQIILAIWFLFMFSFSAYDAIFYSNTAWNIVLSMHNWYILIYLCTIALVFAGLAWGDFGGKRASNNILHYNDNRKYFSSRH
jgi:hypothetical protein